MDKSSYKYKTILFFFPKYFSNKLINLHVIFSTFLKSRSLTKALIMFDILE